MTDKYNGWTNYPTWAINLWAKNEPGSYEMFLEIAREAINDEAKGKGNAVFTMADRLRKTYEEAANDLVGAGEFSDVLTWAIQCVNWDEIAASWIADIRESEPAE